MQKLHFEIDGHDETFTVFTTRPDTLFGATYAVLAPEHTLVEKITTAEQKQAVEAYLDEVKMKSDLRTNRSCKRENRCIYRGLCNQSCKW